jgi:hypothetical protein
VKQKYYKQTCQHGELFFLHNAPPNNALVFIFNQLWIEPQALSGVLAPVGTPLVKPGILHVVTTAWAESPGVVFEKFQKKTAPYTRYFKNINRLPKRSILPWAHCFSHFFSP